MPKLASMTAAAIAVWSCARHADAADLIVSIPAGGPVSFGRPSP